MNPRYTVLEIATRLDVDREVARGLIKFLVETGLAEQKGERKPEGGRGRAEAVYVFVDDYDKLLAIKMKRAKLV